MALQMSMFSLQYFILSLSRDILPFTLKLPQAIIQAMKYEDMEVISTLGVGNTKYMTLQIFKQSLKCNKMKLCVHI